MAIYAEPSLAVSTKEDTSPLTQADLTSNRVITQGLLDLDLGWPVLSEESAQVDFSERQAWSRFWLVDPLDGTKEFIKRNGEFTVNIALIENGRPILGVVYAPALGLCYYAARGMGAFLKRSKDDAKTIRTRPHIAGHPIKVVSSRSHAGERTAALLAQLGEHECLSMGSSLKLCLVASGLAHFYPRLGPTMEWDTAAAHAIVSEAHGIVCKLDGSELHYNKPDLRNPEFLVIPAKGDMLLIYRAIHRQPLALAA